jgi:peptide/nickel transport system ATP-binding protein
MGRIVELSDAATLFSAPRHPYTQALLASALTADPTLPLPDLGLGTSYPDPMNLPTGCSFHPRCPVATDTCRQTRPELQSDTGGRVACHLCDPSNKKTQSTVA